MAYKASELVVHWKVSLIHLLTKRRKNKHKLLQILVNLIQNAKNALFEGGLPDKRLNLRVGLTPEGLVRISVSDNGVGIAPENLTRVFAHGFTTRKAGHGFGLHSSGMFVHNPPWTLEPMLRELMPYLVATLGGDEGAGFTLETGQTLAPYTGTRRV